MEFFNQAIEFLPKNWKPEDYHNKTYVLVDLEEDSEEYKEIQQYCEQNGIKNIIKIKRIQHPFAYLRFKLNLEFQKEWGVSYNQARDHVRISEDALELYIQYNCDRRRQRADFRAKDFVIRSYVDLTPERDTNWYPEYLVNSSC